tara:strand:- start:207 stop:650 length:444 start_codon:yes stop_codon:yes gene_type:complete
MSLYPVHQGDSRSLGSYDPEPRFGRSLKSDKPKPVVQRFSRSKPYSKSKPTTQKSNAVNTITRISTDAWSVNFTIDGASVNVILTIEEDDRQYSVRFLDFGGGQIRKIQAQWSITIQKWRLPGLYNMDIDTTVNALGMTVTVKGYTF